MATASAAVDIVPLAAFAAHLEADVRTLPRNVCLVGWSGGRWLAAPHRIYRHRMWTERAVPTMRFLEQRVRASMGLEAFWFALCLFDGWRERIAWTDRYRWVDPGELDHLDEWRGAPGELPRLSARRPWVACYAGHVGDPSAFLLPETFWLTRGFHRPLFDDVARLSPPWDTRRAHAVYAGRDQGPATNLFTASPDGLRPRRLLERVVRDEGLPVDVTLGGKVSRETQLGYKWILDVDGYVRTWDGWAWKMASGSAVLSPASPWETYFTREFAPWEHFVPVANDFSDLGERLAWCRDHDDECRAIAERARSRAIEAYAPERVAGDVARRLRERLAA